MGSCWRLDPAVAWLPVPRLDAVWQPADAHALTRKAFHHEGTGLLTIFAASSSVVLLLLCCFCLHADYLRIEKKPGGG